MPEASLLRTEYGMSENNSDDSVTLDTNSSYPEAMLKPEEVLSAGPPVLDKQALNDQLGKFGVSDTPSPLSHGFMRQFDAWTADTFSQLEEIVSLGLEDTENLILIELAAKLIKLATIHDSEAADKVLSLL